MKTKILSATTLALLIGILANGLTPLASAELGEAKDAYFTSTGYSAKIYDGKPSEWRFTVYNENCASNEEGEAWFFLTFYLDGEFWWSEYNNTDSKTWKCAKEHSVTLRYVPGNWDATTPMSHNVKIELYWHHNGTHYLEDSASFNFDVVLLSTLRQLRPFSYLMIYLLASIVLLYVYFIVGVEPEL